MTDQIPDSWKNGYDPAANEAAEIIISMWGDLQDERENTAEEQDMEAGDAIVQSNVAAVVEEAIAKGALPLPRAWGMLSLFQKQAAMIGADEVWPGTSKAVLSMLTAMRPTLLEAKEPK